jgi:glycosyltransferase involved in cell wall biosynthesis
VRFCFLQFGMTGYNHACLRALNAAGNEILNVFPGKSNNYEFDLSAYDSYGQTLVWQGAPDQAELDRAVAEFDPEVVVMVSWAQPEYRKVMKRLSGRALRILVSTNIWEGRPKQWLGQATRRYYIEPLYDAVFVPGERSESFARRLGFSGAQIIRGSNTADVDVFDRGPRDVAELAAARRFLFSGRLMPYKAVPTLIEAYQRYRAATDDPWDLDVVGIGELQHLLEGQPGVRMHGFISPTEMSELMHSTTCLVLPSMIDFFGVVVHEAALSGQLLICSDGVGATPYLLQDGFNGWTVPAGDAGALAAALGRVAALSPEQLHAMSTGSRNLASRFSPALWAAHLTEEAARRRAALKLA